MCQETIESLKSLYGCTVDSVVTDNAKNMSKMRQLLHEDNPSLFVYGYNAHWINLLGQDVPPSSITKQVVEVQKYFRNHHQPSAWLKSYEGSVKPQLPGETRWNSQLTCLDTFLRNRPFMIKITEDHSSDVDITIARKINDYNIYCQVRDLYDQLKPIAEGLDRLQGDASTLADACDVWLSLLNHPQLQAHRASVQKRMDEAIQPFHLAAYLLHHKYRGHRLTEQQMETAREWVCSQNEDFAPMVTAFEAEATPFPQSYWGSTVKSMDSHVWWKAIGKQPGINKEFAKTVARIHQLPSSSHFCICGEGVLKFWTSTFKTKEQTRARESSKIGVFLQVIEWKG